MPVVGPSRGNPMSPTVDASNRVPLRQGQWTRDADGRVEVHRQKFGRFGTFLLRMVRIKPHVTLRLDAVGSAAWELMDGERTVEDILPLLEAQFPEEGRLDERLAVYLSRLVRSGVVALNGDA